MKSSNRRIILTLAIVLAVILSACGATPTATPVPRPTVVPVAATLVPVPNTAVPVVVKPFGIGVVHIGPVTDKGWTAAHDVGLRLALAGLGQLEGFDKVKGWISVAKDTEQGITKYRVTKGGTVTVELDSVENVYKDEDYLSAVTGWIKDGKKLIIGTAENYCPLAADLAKQYPDVSFATIRCDYPQPTPKNLATYFGRSYQAWAVAGYAAGLVTDNACFVGAMEKNAQVASNIGGFWTGFMAATNNKGVLNPPLYSGEWNLADKETLTAQSCLPGAKLYAAHQDTVAVGKVALDRNLLAIGYDSDWSIGLASMANVSNVLTSVIWHWDVLYSQFINGAMAGSFPNGRHWLPLGARNTYALVTLVPFSSKVSADNAAKANAYWDQIVSGQVKVFPTLSDEQIWSNDNWKKAVGLAN